MHMLRININLHARHNLHVACGDAGSPDLQGKIKSLEKRRDLRIRYNPLLPSCSWPNVTSLSNSVCGGDYFAIVILEGSGCNSTISFAHQTPSLLLLFWLLYGWARRCDGCLDLSRGRNGCFPELPRGTCVQAVKNVFLGVYNGLWSARAAV